MVSEMESLVTRRVCGPWLGCWGLQLRDMDEDTETIRGSCSEFDGSGFGVLSTSSECTCVCVRVCCLHDSITLVHFLPLSHSLSHALSLSLSLSLSPLHEYMHTYVRPSSD